MNNLSTLQQIAVWSLPILLAITVHEFAHGWVALKLGDQTAKMLGRLTLNPLKHIDPIGTVVVPVALLLIGGFIFGWAKPVPIGWKNLKNPKRDIALVALAGPMANLFMAILWALVWRIGVELTATTSWLGMPLAYMGAAGVMINTILLVLNLLPLPPLDGGRILTSLLPNRLSDKVDRLEPYGLVILLVLMFTGYLGMVLYPAIGFVQTGIFSLFGR
ncbi:MAG: site-2 protease family protein [Thiohalomonadales bacterium]